MTGQDAGEGVDIYYESKQSSCCQNFISGDYDGAHLENRHTVWDNLCGEQKRIESRI